MPFSLRELGQRVISIRRDRRPKRRALRRLVSTSHKLDTRADDMCGDLLTWACGNLRGQSICSECTQARCGRRMLTNSDTSARTYFSPFAFFFSPHNHGFGSSERICDPYGWMLGGMHPGMTEAEGPHYASHSSAPPVGFFASALAGVRIPVVAMWMRQLSRRALCTTIRFYFTAPLSA